MSLRKLKLDEMMRKQETGAITAGRAARLYTGHANRRAPFYAACWLRHLQIVAETRDRRAKR
jgi:hypothetical protein